MDVERIKATVQEAQDQAERLRDDPPVNIVRDGMATFISQKPCTCPDTPEWENYHHPDCPDYTSCGGWGWEPPCGGCDYCMAAQDSYYRSLENNQTDPQGGTDGLPPVR
ncbi:hypothetical protein [Nonomuraea sp. NPDC050786]|uniref:hypothetical protein n=1 Tax=Nonomuraea sp. NPDC050786 TaxID=3154840 RepID=UPI0033F834A1